MKTSIRISVRPLMVAAFSVIVAGRMSAQTFTTLYSFSATPLVGSGQNEDGGKPYGGLILKDNTLFGTASIGGSLGFGTVFAIQTDGTGFTNLYSLNGTNDGSGPNGSLILSSNVLYGTTAAGGSNYQRGTVFAINTDGSEFRVLYSFSKFINLHAYTNNDGANPQAGLVLLGNTLYGTANIGGEYAVGTIFAVNTDGTGFTNLHTFDAQINSPYSALILSGSTLYGTAIAPVGGGVFAINTDGTGFTNIYHFTGGLDGSAPYARLLLSDSTLYSTTHSGGSAVHGNVFAINTNGTGFKDLHTFTPLRPTTNGDGANPYTGLILSGNTLYGTAYSGGSSGNGAVFALNIDGTGFTNLHSFTATSSGTNNDGAKPYGDLILSGDTLYGTTTVGGTSGNGTLFSISLPAVRPQLTINSAGENSVLTWPTNASSFTLQFATNLLSSVWSTNLPAPVVVNGQCTLTNPISGQQQFFRLSQP